MKPWDKPQPMKKHTDIFLPPETDEKEIIRKAESSSYCGFIVNLHNSKVNSVYKRFKIENQIPVYVFLDMEQRADFERYIISLFPSEFAKWHNENQKNFTLDGKTQKWIEKLGVLKNAKR